MHPFFQCTTVAMGSFSFLPVGWIVLSPIFMGWVNVASNTPTVAIHSPGVSVWDDVRLSGVSDAHTPDPKLTGCAETLMSGVEMNMAAISS